MPNTPRVVLDTNILISATIVAHGMPARILEAVLADRIRLIVSPYIIAEYMGVVRRPHIVNKYPKLTEQFDTIRRYLQTSAILAEPSEIDQVIHNDPKDDAILACAQAGQADYIVSGDEHLLTLLEYRGIKILTPRTFLKTVLQEETT